MGIIEIMNSIHRKRWITTTGLALLPPKVLRGEYQMLAGYFQIMGDTRRWMLADVVKTTEDELMKDQRKFKWSSAEYRERLDAKYAELMRDYPEMSREGLERAGRVAWAYPHDNRRQSRTVGYLHHEALMTRSEVERNAYLDRAEAEGWTVEEMKKQLDK